jgi:dolichol-phosphate mannosyltransferase
MYLSNEGVKMAKTLAVVIPCLNEAPNLEVLLPRIHDVLAKWRIPAQVYVIDGGSTDGTPEAATRLGATVIQQQGEGYGGATKTAFASIDAEYLITLDADFSHHPAFIKYLYEMRDQAEIVVASRYAPQGNGAMPPLRTLLSGLLNLVFRRILDMPVHDLSSGYRLYHRRAIQKLDLEYDTYAVLQEILVKAMCQGYQIKEIPFHYLPRRHGKTHAQLFRFAVVYLKALRSLWSLRNSIDSADYDTRAFKSRIPLQRWWQRKRYKIILNYIGDSLRVLDAGCGSTQMLNGAPQMVGMDIQHKKLRFMRRPGRSLVNASTFALPFKDEAFEVVISSQVIEHIPEDEVIFKELVRCLEPGGTLILGTPDYDQWWPLIEKVYGFVKPTGYADEHITHYTRESLSKWIEKMGLEIEDHAYILRGELIMKARKKGASEQQ